jgi:hypothetical protein
MRRIGIQLGVALVLVALHAAVTEAEVQRLVIGQGGVPWREVAEEIAALEDTTVAGSLQPREFFPHENVLLGPRGSLGQYTNLLELPWVNTRTGLGSKIFRMGYHPRYWQLTAVSTASGQYDLIDGDPDVGVDFWKNNLNFDMGIPLPLTRVVFYAPEQGFSRVSGESFRNMYPQEYEVTAQLEAIPTLLLAEETVYHPLSMMLGSTFYNSKRVVELEWEPTTLRFVRFHFPRAVLAGVYTLSEIEIYAEGYPQRTWYLTQIIDMGEPVNFGSVSWGLSGFRKTAVGEPAEPDPQAPVRATLTTRTGKDATPLAYHLITDIGKEREVSEVDFSRALAPSVALGPLPGNRGSVTDDTENWSFWSSDHTVSGQQMASPDARRYVKLNMVMESDEILAFGRLDSIAIEYSPLLAERVVGEVALLDEPRPNSGITRAVAGVDTTFSCDIRAAFGAASQGGFDAVRLQTPSAARFVGLEMGDPLAPVTAASFEEGESELLVHLPGGPISQRNNVPIRILFRSAVLSYSSHFTGEVFNSAGEDLPQSIEPGDASPNVGTETMQVFSSTEELRVLNSVELVPRVLSPNGDEINDRTRLSFVLLGVERSAVTVGIHDLSGREVRRLVSANWGRKVYEVTWDGTGEDGGRVPPGLYLCQVSVETDTGSSQEIRPVAVAY